MPRQLALPLGADPIAVLAGLLGPSQLVLEDAAAHFLAWGRIPYVQTDVPESALIEAATAIWTADELAELRGLQAAGDLRAETLCRARLIRRIAPQRARYWEGGWE